MWIILFPLLLIAIFTVLVKKMFDRNREYTGRKGVGPYFIEEGKVFINAPYPQRVQASPLNQVDHVQIFYDYGAHKASSRFTVTLTIVNKDGSKSKDCYFTYWMTQRSAPDDIAAGLTAAGVPSKVVTNKK